MIVINSTLRAGEGSRDNEYVPSADNELKPWDNNNTLLYGEKKDDFDGNWHDAFDDDCLNTESVDEPREEVVVEHKTIVSLSLP